MDSLEPKKLALLRILQILHQYSDSEHPLKQETIAHYLDVDYGITLERKAVSRNLKLLKDADFEICFDKDGCYLLHRTFENAELRMLIDSVLCSKSIPAGYSKDLIDRLCTLSNQYFKANVKHVYTVDQWNKTDNRALFLNIDLIDEAIENHRQLRYTYNKYGIDKKLHRSSTQYVSPYQMILHNQTYYLMAFSSFWKNIVFHRIDRMTDMKITDRPATPINGLKGYENGIDYKEISSALPYMYTDKPERIDFISDMCITDQIVDWFGHDIVMTKDAENPKKVRVRVKASPKAMKHWAMQYIDHVEITYPESLRKSIQKSLNEAIKKY